MIPSSFSGAQDISKTVDGWRLWDTLGQTKGHEDEEWVEAHLNH